MSRQRARSWLLTGIGACLAAGCSLFEQPGPSRPVEFSWFKAPTQVRVGTSFTIAVEIYGRLCDETVEASAVVDEASRRITFKGLVRGQSASSMACGSSWSTRPFYLDATVSTPGTYVVVATIRPMVDLARYAHLVPRIEKLSPEVPVEASQSITAE